MIKTLPRHTSRRYPPQIPPKGGFALVVAMVLMGFILMLALSLSNLVLMESTSASVSASQAEARQNALLAMNLAIGELQRSLGPDRRASARGEILDASPDEAGTVTGVAQPFWTGVWDSDGTLMTWLVSGNGAQAPLQWSAVNADLPADSDTVVSLVAPGGGVEQEVRAPIVKLPEVGGGFAYWVGDEGVKAKVNLHDSSSELTNANLFSSQRFGIQIVDGMDWFPQDNPDLISRLYSADSLGLLPGSPTESDISRTRFHDLSFYSHGVLSDSRKGGLKKDLTTGLFDSGATQPSGDIFPPVTSATPLPQDPGGPSWNQLRSWLQTPIDNGTLPVRPSSDNSAGFYPVVSAFRLYMLPTYDPVTRQVNIHLMPSLVLWNPYDKPLETASYSVKMGRSYSGNSFGHTRDIFYFTGPPGPATNPATGGVDYGWVIQLQNSASTTVTSALWNKFEPVIFHVPDVQLGPGESMVFSPPAGAHHPYRWSSQGTMTTDTNVLLPGFRPQWSYYYPLPHLAPLGYLALDADGDPLTEYILYQATQSRIMAINFSLGSADNPTHLTDIVHLSTQNPVTPPPSDMIAFSVNTPFFDDYRATAPGLFFQRQYVDNDLDVEPSKLRARNQWLGHYNPRAATQGSNPFFYTLPQGGSYGYNNNPSNNPSFIGFADRFNDNQGVKVLGSDRVPVGLSEVSNIGRTILFEAPPGRSELHSIGQLQHAPLYRWHASWQTTLSNDLARLRERMERARYDNLLPAYAVGNSAASPLIPSAEVAVQWPSPSDGDSAEAAVWRVRGWHYDYSYLLNQNLWDSFFFSTLSRDADSDDADSDPFVAENRRIRILDPEATEAELFTYDTAAANVLLDGAFNVNSTSEEAWRAFLGSFWGQDVSLANKDTVSGAQMSAYLRTRLPHGGDASGGEPDDSEVYDGFRSLDQDQINALATEIVRQVKLRGPFTTLGDFVNRSRTADDEALRLAGALAEAIDRSKINESLQTTDYRAVTTDDAFPSGVSGVNASAEEGWRTTGLPGWLSQADLLSRLGSSISARSDTFLIRTYGEATDPATGNVLASAWAEAVVQRMPAYVVDSSVEGGDRPETAFADLVNSENQLLGRRFQVVSFRWLHKTDL